MILGGQHILKALWQMRTNKLQTTKEEDLPPSLRFCFMEVITSGAPYGLRAYMAGRHQLTQSAAEAATLSDFFSLVVDQAFLKKEEALAKEAEWKRQHPGLKVPVAPDRCCFSDPEIWVLLERSGLMTDNIVPTEGVFTATSKPSLAESQHQSKV